MTVLDQWERKFGRGCDLRGKRGLRCAGVVTITEEGHHLCDRHAERLAVVLAEAEANLATQRLRHGLEPRAQGT